MVQAHMLSIIKLAVEQRFNLFSLLRTPEERRRKVWSSDDDGQDEGLGGQPVALLAKCAKEKSLCFQHCLLVSCYTDNLYQ